MIFFVFFENGWARWIRTIDPGVKVRCLNRLAIAQSGGGGRIRTAEP